MKNKVIILIIMILCCMNLLSEWTDFQDGISYFIENESESDIDDEIKDLLCYQNKIIMADDYVYILK